MAQSIMELHAFLESWEERVTLGLLWVGYAIACIYALRGPRK
jgi:hypothetical protein